MGQLIVIVTNEELLPVPGARVAVPEVDLANFTGDDGRVAFNLAPGVYDVRVESYGHESTEKTVEVLAQEVSEVIVQLVALPSREPYSAVRIHAGMSSCTVPLLWGIFDFGDVCKNTTVARSDPVLFTGRLDGWAWLAQELSWSGSHWFTMFTDNAALGTVALKHLSIRHGPSPIRVTAFPGQVATGHNPTHFEPYPAANTSLRIHSLFAGYFGEVFRPIGSACNVGHDSGCMGVGTAVEARFTLYLSVFYYEPPADPDSYSALPDG